MKDIIRAKIQEGLGKLVEFKKDDEKSDDEVKDQATYDLTYSNIRSALDNELINHAAVIRELWGESNATNRSEFRKKLELETSDSGSKYKFTEDEVGRIETILTTFRDDLGGSINKGTEKKED